MPSEDADAIERAAINTPTVSLRSLVKTYREGRAAISLTRVLEGEGLHVHVGPTGRDRALEDEVGNYDEHLAVARLQFDSNKAIVQVLGLLFGEHEVGARIHLHLAVCVEARKVGEVVHLSLLNLFGVFAGNGYLGALGDEYLDLREKAGLAARADEDTFELTEDAGLLGGDLTLVGRSGVGGQGGRVEHGGEQIGVNGGEENSEGWIAALRSDVVKLKGGCSSTVSFMFKQRQL